ncbi:chaperone protein DnaK [Striga asiatica]|uniref:Chaperone protein DnaK n=1 Tax=Striga asiatica TaxID=4170 RepID=A0A5A7Q6F8_STRAF|nr:chaperone protein DnaK [Striga asiatica]
MHSERDRPHLGWPESEAADEKPRVCGGGESTESAQGESDSAALNKTLSLIRLVGLPSISMNRAATVCELRITVYCYMSICQWQPSEVIRSLTQFSLLSMPSRSGTGLPM